MVRAFREFCGRYKLREVIPDSEEAAARRNLRLGILLCLTATMFYSFANVCFKEMNALGMDDRWMIFVKELFTITCLTPLIIYWTIRRQYHWPALKWIVCVLIGGFFCQYIGARLHLWAIGTVGLVVSIPLIQAANMSGAAGIGRVLLGDRISTHCQIAMVIMLAAMCCLLFGPNQPDEKSAATTAQIGEAQELSAQPVVGKTLLLGGIGALVAGFSYSVHIVLLRKASVSRQIPVTFIAVQITGTGAVIFGFEFLQENGFHLVAIWENVPLRAWWLILLTGFLNMIGFLFQINGVRYTVVARSQMIAVAQIVIGTLFGVFFYREMTNDMIWLGLALTVLGIYYASTPDQKELSVEGNF